VDPLRKREPHATDGAAAWTDAGPRRKTAGRWRYVEYGLSGSRYSAIGQGSLCQTGHAQARANDYVFTRR